MEYRVTTCVSGSFAARMMVSASAAGAAVQCDKAAFWQRLEGICEGDDGLEAGFGFGGAAGEGCFMRESVVIAKILEWKAVCKNQRFPFALLCQFGEFPVQRVELLDVG